VTFDDGQQSTGPPNEGDGPDTAETATTTADQGIDTNEITASRQVCWWTVHEHVAALLATMQTKSWPFIGTPAWCALGDDDPRKLAAVIDSAQHWALRLETGQQARCEASREISAAFDWSALAKRSRTHSEFYAARPWLKRVVS
jgi:hypothetical protein